MAIPTGLDGPVAARLADRVLTVSPRLRRFGHDGREYGHLSGLPLTYLRLSAQTRTLLDHFSTPNVPGPDADRQFLQALIRTGVLLDAEEPDPIHGVRLSSETVRSLYLYPTNSCNLRCVYCYATSGPGAGPRLSIEHAFMAVDDFFATLDPTVRKVALVFHGGGEPTTNFSVMTKAWDRFSERARERALITSVSTITNGAFGPHVLRVLSNPPWRVTVSYDGPVQGTQRPTAANRDSRDRVVSNLKALIAAGQPVTTRATLTRDALPLMPDVVDDAAEIGLRSVQVELASGSGRGGDLRHGPDDAAEFALAYLDSFRYAMQRGVRLSTSASSHLRMGDGRYCGAITGMRALTPDGFVSACTQTCEGSNPGNPFIVGRLDTVSGALNIWPVREQRLQERTGYNLPHCSSCYMVDTCAGGCAARAYSEGGDAFAREVAHCVVARIVNPALIADIASGRLLPDEGWQPITAESGEEARLVALIPAAFRGAWNADPARRPAFATPGSMDPFFHLSE